MTKQHRDEFQRGRESLHGEMEMLRQINSDLLAALKDAEFLLRKAGQVAGPMQDSFNRSAVDARAAIAKAKGE